MDNLFTEPDPRERLLEALDPQGQTDAGLAVTIANDMPANSATVLAELIERRIERVTGIDITGRTEAGRRLFRSLQPGDSERGLIVALVLMLGADASLRLADLIGHAIADGYERGRGER
jgi:hypothetical protein